MRQKVFGRKLSRGGGARKALYVAIVRALVINGDIKTTKAKAKAVIPEIERLVSLARKGNSAKIAAFFGNNRKIALDFTNMVRQFSERNSGFSRIINLPPRVGDSAEMVRLMWVENIVKSEKNDSQKSKKNSKLVKPKEATAKESKTLKTKKK